MTETVKVVEFKGHRCAVKVKPAAYIDGMIYITAVSKYSGGRKAKTSCMKKNAGPTIRKLLKAVTRW